ncbi:superoxide dismutase family protein [Virgibacillus sp. W0430]|uniref:superoxide dismutase family protein n=1 Tax=Virgibacillus sp. W0430 TaxID=3391580 RepID=UPI003F470169
MKFRLMKLFILPLSIAIMASGCGNMDDNAPEQEKADEAIEVDKGIETEGGGNQTVTVELKNTDGATVGTAVVEAENEGVKISLRADHLTPGVHGFHIHEKGICESPDFKSAGGHFNPTDKKHGFDHEAGPHAGDMPNITVKEGGTVEEEIVNEFVTLEKGKENTLFSDEGTALIIHSKADDYISQPAGNAGDRIVCGVISDPK